MIENIAIIGIILFIAVIGGRMAAFFGLPMVTGYIVAGVFLGESYFNVINITNQKDLQILADIAIGFIIFSIGGFFRFEMIRKRWKKILAISLSETMMTAGVVFLFCFIYSLFLPLSFTAVVFISIIAISTAPAATVMVLREYDPEGPVTNYLYALLGMNNFISILLFSIAGMAFLLVSGKEVTAVFSWMPVYLKPIWFVFGSMLAGSILGLALAYFEHYEKNSNQILIYVLASILISIVLAKQFEMSFLLICLSMGITVINTTSKSESMFEILKNSDPPLYAIFFVLAGAKFDIHILHTIGFLGIGYLIARAAGKVIGTWFAAKKLDEQATVRKFLGMALLPQAGLALSIAHVISNDYGEMGAAIFTLVVSTSIIYETVGPVFTKIAVFRAGEVKTDFLVNVNTISKFKSKSRSFVHHLFHKAALVFSGKKVKTHSTVKDEMIKDAVVIKDNTPFREIVKILKKYPYNYVPVVDEGNNYTGIVTSQIIKELLFDDVMNNLILARDVATKDVPVVYPDTFLIEALGKFDRDFLQYLLVLESENSSKIVGILDKSDLMDTCKRIREKRIFRN